MVLGKQPNEDIPDACRHVYKRPFFTQTQSRRDSCYESNRLDNKGPVTKVTFNNETSQNRFNLVKKREIQFMITKAVNESVLHIICLLFSLFKTCLIECI